jgi:glycosyltransferase involved in cell wall biosynthesis
VNIALVSSDGNCGVYEASQILRAGFEANGHRVRYVGVQRGNARDLREKLRQISADDELVIFEYEPGIFRLQPLARAMHSLRRKRIFLSIHELDSSKFTEYRQVVWRLNEAAWRNTLMMPFSLLRGVADVAYRYVTLRTALHQIGTLPERIIIHSPALKETVALISADAHKVHYTPLPVKPLPGDRDAMRRALGLPVDRFAFIAPGFLFRRKRITDIIAQLPTNVELWVVGRESSYERGYMRDIQLQVQQSGKQDQVRLIQDYDEERNIEPYIIAADVVVLYYRDVFQSAVACQAMGAGKPCIVSNLPGFGEYHAASIAVESPQDLHQAMLDIQDAQRYDQLRDGTAKIREAHTSQQIAARYLE